MSTLNQAVAQDLLHQNSSVLQMSGVIFEIPTTGNLSKVSSCYKKTPKPSK